MFRSAKARYILRGIVSGIAAASAAAATVWVDNPYVKVVTGGIAAASVYFGIGAISPQVEPFVGIKKADPGNLVRPDEL